MSTIKYKNYIYIYDDICVNYIVDLLFSFYNKKDFKNIKHTIDEIIDKNNFISDKIKEKIMFTYRINFKLKNIINKCIKNWRFKKLKSINKKTLELEEISSINNSEKIELLINNKLYIFHYQELLKICINSLENNDDMFPDPIHPCNPYTNEKFKKYQLKYIYDKLLEIHFNNRKELPLSLGMLKQANFNVITMYNNHKNYFIKKACRNHVYQLSNKEWLSTLDDFIKDYDLKSKICISCIKEIDNYRDVFSKILIKYELDNNYVGYTKKTKNSYVKSFLKIVNIYGCDGPCLKHRKIFRCKRKFNKNLGYSFDPNTNLDFNFGNTTQTSTPFVFTANSQFDNAETLLSLKINE